MRIKTRRLEHDRGQELNQSVTNSGSPRSSGWTDLRLKTHCNTRKQIIFY